MQSFPHLDWLSPLSLLSFLEFAFVFVASLVLQFSATFLIAFFFIQELVRYTLNKRVAWRTNTLKYSLIFGIAIVILNFAFALGVSFPPTLSFLLIFVSPAVFSFVATISYLPSKDAFKSGFCTGFLSFGIYCIFGMIAALIAFFQGATLEYNFLGITVKGISPLIGYWASSFMSSLIFLIFCIILIFTNVVGVVFAEIIFNLRRSLNK